MVEPETFIPNARHEHSDIGAGFIWAATASMLGLLLACALLVGWLYPSSLSDTALQRPLPVFPAPLLQADPGADMRAFRAKQMQQLDSTGWMDPERQVLHIPIADAIRIVAREGVPGWPTPGAPP
jgi:hypothetical protein